MHGRIIVQFGDLVEHPLRCHISWKRKIKGNHTGLVAGFDLVADINLGGRVFADQNHRQTGARSLQGQFIGANFEFGAQTFG